MLHFLPAPLLGLISFVLAAINTVFWCSLLFLATFLKLIIPIKAWRVFCSKILMAIGAAWIDGNGLILALTQRVRWDVRGMENLSRDSWYLVISNHQAWTDILILQKIFNRRIPFLKFFLKQELIWVPILGPAWWALDFPFMKRYSRHFLEKHPELKGKDLETTRKACERFRTLPVSVINFVEGTRFREEKRIKQGAPFRHLLSPRAGGVAFTLSAMGKYFTSVLDVTIVYPEGSKRIWDLFTGRVREIIVRVRSLPVPHELFEGNYDDDPQAREKFHTWLNGLWMEKDELIHRILENPPSMKAAG